MGDYVLYHPLRTDDFCPRSPLGVFARWSGLDFAPYAPPRATPLSMVLGTPEGPPPTSLRCDGPAADHRTFAALTERGRLDELVRLELRGTFTGETLRLAAALPRLEVLVCKGVADVPPTGLSFPRLKELCVEGSAAAWLVDPQVTPALTRLTIDNADLEPTSQAHVRERPLVALTLGAVSIERRALIKLLDTLRGSLQRLALHDLHVDDKRRPFMTRWLDGEWPALVDLELGGARLVPRLPGGLERLTLTDVELLERAPSPPPGLTALALSRCEPAVVAAFIGHAPRLRALEVWESDEAERLVAAALAPGGQLEALSLTGGRKLEDQRRVTIPADAPPLRALNLDSSWTLGHAVESLCTGELSPGLTHLRVQIGASVWCELDRLSPAFEVFILEAGPGFCLHGFTAAPPPPRLRTFAVSYVNVLGNERGALGAWLAQCRHLKTLELGFNGFDANEIAHALRSLAPQLESALFDGWTGMNEYDEEELVNVLCTSSSWPNLVFLDLRAFPFGPESSVRVAAATVDMPRLERLGWSGSDLSAGVDALAEHGSPRLSCVLIDSHDYKEAAARLSRADARVANAEISIF